MTSPINPDTDNHFLAIYWKPEPMLGVTIEIPYSWNCLGWHYFLDLWQWFKNNWNDITKKLSLSRWLKYEASSSHLFVCSYLGFIRGGYDDDNEETDMWFLAFNILHYSSRYPKFLSLPDLIPSRSQKPLPVSLWLYTRTDVLVVNFI